VRFCTSVQNYSATIAAGATYTKTGLIEPGLIAPAARHGFVTVIRVSPNVDREALRYTLARVSPARTASATTTSCYRCTVS
jgi:hypothetical protein